MDNDDNVDMKLYYEDLNIVIFYFYNEENS